MVYGAFDEFGEKMSLIISANRAPWNSTYFCNTCVVPLIKFSKENDGD